MHQKHSLQRTPIKTYSQSVLDEDGSDCVAPESDEEIVYETLYQSQMKNHTRIKSWKVVVPEALIPSDSEDDVCRPQQCKCNHASPAPIRAGRKAKNIRHS